jgi:hypothetical protein
MNNKRYRASQVAAGFVCSFIGLYLAIHLVGPIIRTWLGVPEGFNQDHPTHQAWLQARGVQLLSLGLVFFFFGIVSGMVKAAQRAAYSFWTANPISMGLAYWTFQTLFSSRGPGEYFGDVGLVLLSVLSPVLLAPSMVLGVMIGGRLRTSIAGDHA